MKKIFTNRILLIFLVAWLSSTGVIYAQATAGAFPAAGSPLCTDGGTVGWTNPGTVDTIVVFAKKSATQITLGTHPKPASSYTANTVFGSGTPYEGDPTAFCIYRGTGTSVAITGLLANTQYQFLVYDVKGVVYSTDLRFSGSTQAHPSDVVPGIITPGNTQVTLNWANTANCFQEVVIIASEDPSPTIATPTGDGSSLNASAAYGTVSALYATHQYVVYKGTGTTVTVTGLANCTLTTFQIFTHEASDWSTGVSVTSTPTSPLLLTSFLPTGTGISTNTSLTFTFNQAVKQSTSVAGAGEDKILVNAGATTIQTIDRSSITGTSTTFTITGTPLLTNNTDYTVVIGDKVFASVCGSDFTGTPAWTFKTNVGVTKTKPSPTICPGPFTALGSIVIAEAAANNIQATAGSTVNITLSITDPKIAFEPGIGSIDISGAPDIASKGIAVIGFSTATFPVTFRAGNAQSAIDVITFAGLKVVGDITATTSTITISTSPGLTVENLTNNETMATVTVNSGGSAQPTGATFSSGTGTYCGSASLSGIVVQVSPNVPTIKWYSDAGLTNLVYSGMSATHPTFADLHITASPAVALNTTIYATNTSGCESSPLSIPITIYPSPKIDAGTFPAQCSGTKVELGGSPTIKGPSTPSYVYAWSEKTGNYTGPALAAVPNPFTSALDNLTSSPVPYDFKVIVTDSVGCKGADSTSFNVTPVAKPSLTKPATTFFTTKSPSQVLGSNFKTINFTGIGVVQTNAVTYSFDPASAYDPNSLLPQSFHIFFNGIDTVTGCAINDYDIATMTLSNSTFLNVLPQYCADEFPVATEGPPPSVNLQLNNTTGTYMNAYVASWNASYRFNFVYPGDIPEYNIFSPYKDGDLVHLGPSGGGNIYRAKGNVPAFIFPTNTLFWATDGFEVNFTNHTIKNLYDGVYGGPLGAPSIYHAHDSVYFMGTNGKYVGNPTANAVVPAIYVEFNDYRDVRYYMSSWDIFEDYKPGDITVDKGVIYKCILETDFPSVEPSTPGGPTYWIPYNGSFNLGSVYYDASTGLAGIAVRSQYVQINPNPPVSFSIGGSNVSARGGVLHNICESDISGTGNLTADLNSNFDAGIPNRGTFQISYDGGTTWLSDAAAGNGVLNTAFNSGLATFNSLNAFQTDSTLMVSSGAFGYNAAKFYNVGDNVIFGSLFYTALIAGSNNVPSSTSSNWLVNTLTVHIRIYYQTGQTGSTHGGPPIGGVGDNCFSTFEQKISIHSRPPLNATSGGYDTSIKVKCATDATAIPFTTNPLPMPAGIPPTTMVVTGFGIFDKGDGTGTFTPSHAYTQAQAAHPTNSPAAVTITAIYTDRFGCSNTAKNNSFVLNPIPPTAYTISNSTKGTFVSNDANGSSAITTVVAACYLDESMVFAPVTPSASYTLSYHSRFFIVFDDGADTSIYSAFTFNPKQFYDMARKSHSVQANSTATFRITFTSSDDNPCSESVPELTLSVSPKLDLTIAGILNGDTYCSNEPDKVLSLSNYNQGASSLSINGVGQPLFGNVFKYPLNLNLGQVVFKYDVTTGTSGTSCQNPVSDTIRVLPSPVASFLTFPRCVGDSVQYVGSDVGPGGAATYLWKFTDSDTIVTSTLQNPFHKWKSQGNNFLVDLRLAYAPVNIKVNGKDTTKQCIANNTGVTPFSIHQQQIIGAIPSVDFSVSHVCKGDTSNFVVSTTNGHGVGVTQYQWTFGDTQGTILGNFATTTHTYADTGTYQVRLVGKTDSLSGGCLDTIKRFVSVLQYLHTNQISPSLPYEMGTTSGGWVREDQKGVSTWHFDKVGVTPDSTIQVEPAWSNIPFVTLDGSYVNSPCFDMTLFKQPAIGLQYFMDVRTQQDGAVLQYSTTVLGGIQRWKTLGSINSGQNWYTTQGISGKPGEGELEFNPNSFGWSDSKDKVWITSKHSLDEIPADSLKTVRFRIAFGSDGGSSTNGARGMAFNNVSIVERNRLALLENFTNENAPNVTTNDNVFDNFVPGGASSVAKIEYHASLPQPDDITKLNSADPDARAAFYGLTNSATYIPRGYLDGTSQGPFVSNAALSNDYKLRSLSASPLSLSLDDSQPNSMVITGTALQDIKTGNLRLYVVAIDNQKFQMRKFFPSASGTIVATPLLKGQTFSVTVSPWSIPETEVKPSDAIGIVAFVQDIDSKNKEVLQAFYKSGTQTITTTTGLEEFGDGIATYPVPANGEFLVELAAPAKQDFKVRLVNGIGQPVVETSFITGEQRKTIGTQNLADGVYILQLGNNGGMLHRKIMVIHP